MHLADKCILIKISGRDWCMEMVGAVMWPPDNPELAVPVLDEEGNRPKGCVCQNSAEMEVLEAQWPDEEGPGACVGNCAWTSVPKDGCGGDPSPYQCEELGGDESGTGDTGTDETGRDTTDAVEPMPQRELSWLP